MRDEELSRPVELSSRQTHTVAMKSLDPLRASFTVTVSSRDFKNQKIIILASSAVVDELSHAATDRHVLITPTAVLIDLARHTLERKGREELSEGERMPLLPEGLDEEDIRDSITRIESYLHNPSLSSRGRPTPLSAPLDSPAGELTLERRARLVLARRRLRSLNGASLSKAGALMAERKKFAPPLGAVTLPAPPLTLSGPASSTPAALKAPILFKGCWILCIDDDKMVRRLLTKNLDPTKTSADSIDTAENGREAIEKVVTYVNKYEEEHEGNFSSFPRGLITMDNTMPICSGPEAVVEIDAFLTSKGIREKVIIVGLTANTTEEELASFKSKGLDAVLTKPIIISRLTKTFKELMGKDRREDAAAEAP